MTCRSKADVQEFVGLLGMEDRCLGSSAMPMSPSSEASCQVVACPCCSGGAESSSHSKESRDTDLQCRQREDSLAAAVEHVLREVGEDPNREVTFFTHIESTMCRIIRPGSCSRTLLYMNALPASSMSSFIWDEDDRHLTICQSISDCRCLPLEYFCQSLPLGF